MNPIVRRAVPDDVPQMLKLVKELASFEKAPGEVSVTEAEMLQSGFGDHSDFKAFVAEENHQLVGLAVFYTGFSTWKGKMIYLDDLYVSESYRRNGLGFRLFEAVARFARNSGAMQLRWHVLDWNAPAISFYKKLNASMDPSWITCKLSAEQLRQF